MKLFLTALSVCCCYCCFGQYYYNDILTNYQTSVRNELLRKNNIRSVTATSYESDNSLSENFRVQQTISQNGNLVVTNSTDAAGISTITRSSFANGKIQSNTDSNANVVTRVNYIYNNEGSIVNISSVTEDAFMNSHSEEQHQWVYANGRPEYMLRIKDKKDTTRVEFVYDEKGNVAEEKWRRRNYTLEHWFYYYNNNNQLTDIVRYNAKAKRMLPDFLFEYDAQGNLVQMTQVPSGGSNYLVWKYSFNEIGLKNSESCFNKQGQPVGKIVYVYQ
ncbi:hypothetical protein [Foetidibacter luteolus]|uniref:hypothetical protein n=1 Tax=Foetidibacter luteolus TaxID=2608880 RepID=UPI00129AAE0A|nr:hypothetical protein [Foetidibacter luteolus]